MKTQMSQETFLNLVKTDMLDDVTFIMELSSVNTKKIKMLSKKSETVVTYEAKSALIKLNEIYHNISNNRLSIRVDDLEKYIIQVDIFTQSYFEETGLSIKDNVINIFNYHIDTEVKKKSVELAKGKTKGTYFEVMDFTKYESIACLMRNIFNPQSEDNKLFNRNNEVIEAFEFNCNWLNFVFTSKQNSSLCPTIISVIHGVGKGIYTNMIQSFFGRDSARIDNNAIKSEFNGILQGKAFTVYDEAVAEDKVNNVLKGLIGNKTHLARSMFSDRKEEKNGNNFMITGNKTDKPVVYIEPEDRRYITFFSREMKIEQAVEEELGISFEQFLSNIEKEKILFFADILRIECDHTISGHQQLMNRTKKILIQEIFGKDSDLIEAIKKGDVSAIEDELFDKRFIHGYDDLIKEISSGYITKSSINFIANNYDDNDFIKSLKKNGLRFWDEAFGKSQKITANNTSFMARKLNNFDRSKIDVKKKNDITGFDDQLKGF